MKDFENDKISPTLFSKKEGFWDALYYIRKVGNYEAKILWRSLLFRIFAILILALLILLNLFGVIGVAGGGSWPGKYIPGNVAYLNFFLFTVAQVIIAAFLSADFLGRERKMDTTEVFYTRPMSNLQYVLGKTWGALQLFFGLSLVIFLMSAVVSLVAPGASLVFRPMFVYLLAYSLPSLLFILGFSFILMTVVRNQAVTFVLVLGFGATVLFYLKGMHNGVWDFMGFYLPMHYSGFVGFSDLSALLWQRLGYILLGLSGVLFTAFFLPRLPGHRYKPWGILFTAVLLMIGTAGIFYKVLHEHRHELLLRREIVEHEQALPSMPSAVIDSCSMQVVHNGSQLNCTVDLHIRRIAHADSLILTLNPGFKVSEVFMDEQPVSFSRKAGLLYIPVTGQWAGNDISLNCRMKYEGAPLDATIYPYVSEENRALLNRTDPLVAGKRYAFVQDDYLLLTREAGWYPVVAWKYYRQQPAFASYQLSVKINDNLQALSQGTSEVSGNWVHFNNSQPLNALTLVAGRYKMDSIKVDSVEYQLAAHQQYGTIKDNFTNLSDTLPALIRDLKIQYESRLGLNYPFARFKMVEVPVHFFSYLQPWSTATDHTQPEMVLVSENGGGAWFGDAYRIKYDFEKGAEREGQDLQPREIEARTFVTLAGTALLYPRWQFQDEGQEIERATGIWNRIQVFPLYYDYVYHILENGYPVFRVMLGEALRGEGQKQSNMNFGNRQNQYSALLNLNSKSLSRWLSTGNYNDTVADILQLQGVNFFSRVSAKTTGGDFLKALGKGFEAYKFKRSTPVQWLILPDGDEEGLLKTYHSLIETEELPFFKFGDMQTAEVVSEGQTRYYVSFEVSNTGKVEGVLDTRTMFLNLEENRNFSFAQWMYSTINQDDEVGSELFLIPADKKVKVEMVFDQLPRHIIVETGVAGNIPPVYNYFPKDFEKKGMSAVNTGVTVLGDASALPDEDFIFIVDNEGRGFTIESKDEIKTLKDWWIKRQRDNIEEYPGINYWNPPVAWSAGFGDNFYGNYLRSALQKVAGTGDDKARWTCDLPEAGNYEVQAYIPGDLHRSWRFRKVRAGFNYLIHHGNEIEEVESPNVNDVRGWVSLGSYYFEKGEAVVELSDRSDYQYVVADAMKWIKQ